MARTPKSKVKACRPNAYQADQKKAAKAKVKQTKQASNKQSPNVAKLMKEEVTNKHLVTRAALRRAACRAGIRCMSKGCFDELMAIFDKKAEDCLLQARNNAYYIRKAKTICSADVVAGSRECGLGDVLVY